MDYTRLLSNSTKSLIDPRPMIDPLDDDDPLPVEQEVEKPEVTYPQIVFRRAREARDEPIRVDGGAFELVEYPSGSRSIKPTEIACRNLGPLDGPPYHSPRRRFASEWSTSLPWWKSSRAWSNPRRNASS